MSIGGRPAAAGGASTLAALGASELAAGAFTAPSLIVSIGDALIDAAPPALKTWAIETFGTGDKPALIIGITIVVTAVGAAIGVAAWRRFTVGVVGFAVLGAVGAAAAVAESPVGAVLVAAVALAVAVVTLRWLFGVVGQEGLPDVGGRADGGRRSFLTQLGAVVVLATAAGAVGRFLGDQARRRAAGRGSVVLPTPVKPVAPPPAGTSWTVPELSPLVTRNEDFYRIDTALTIPRVDLEAWRLRVHGLVDEPYEIGFDELLAMDMVERYVTLSCVSNEVGGPLVGNAKWLGVPLAAVVQRARPRREAAQVVGRSVDGFTVGFPTSVVSDGRDALVAVGMNDEPLPFDHGFPARLVVAGLYGYVSATKWLSEIELTTWDGFDAYWVPRGWSKQAPVKTQSRIDTPRDRATLDAGSRAIAGVAWAPSVGIEKVEVQVGDGPWRLAELAAPLDANSWRQWRVPWTAAPGDHRLRVRATDSSGYTQTASESPPAPDGATGWHSVRVTVA